MSVLCKVLKRGPDGQIVENNSETLTKALIAVQVSAVKGQESWHVAVGNLDHGHNVITCHSNWMDLIASLEGEGEAKALNTEQKEAEEVGFETLLLVVYL